MKEFLAPTLNTDKPNRNGRVYTMTAPMHETRSREEVLEHFFQLVTADDWEGLTNTERRRWMDQAGGDLAKAFQLYRQERYDIVAALPKGTTE